MSKADDASQLFEVSDVNDGTFSIVGDFGRESRHGMPGSSNIDFTPLDDADDEEDADNDEDNSDDKRECLPLPIPPPHHNDSIDTMMKKARTLLRVIQNGKSIAVATGFARTVLDPEVRAFNDMCFEEKIQYWAFKKGFPLPAFDFERDREPVAGFACDLRRRLKTSLNIAYGTNQFNDHHAVWVKRHEKGMIPLLNAIQRVTEQRHKTSRSSEQFKKFAEFQILKKILRDVNNHKWRIVGDCLGYVPMVIQFNDALLARIHAMARHVPRLGQGEAEQKEQAIELSSI